MTTWKYKCLYIFVNASLTRGSLYLEVFSTQSREVHLGIPEGKYNSI